MLLEMLRFVRGYVRFDVCGRYPERFLNITARHGVRLWEVERVGEGFSACMYRSDYRRIRSLARKAGVRLRVKDKRGLPSLAYSSRDRVGLVFGACAFIITVFVTSMFIWSVDISGNDKLSLTHINALLRDNGLYVGAFKPALDAKRLADEVMIDDPDIGWMAVNIEGSYASVEIKEKAEPPKVNDITTPCNVKASRDGVILGIEAAEGSAEVIAGSGVVKGQLLVGGVITGSDGSARLVHASARVLARTKRTAEFSTPDKMTELMPTGEVGERRSAEIFGLRVPFYFASVKSPYALSDQQLFAPSPLDVRLPVGVVVERVTALELRETALDENSAKELLSKQSELYEAFTLSDCTVESRDFELLDTDGVYTLRVTYTCVEDIACTEPIGTDENTDLTKHTAPTEDER